MDSYKIDNSGSEDSNNNGKESKSSKPNMQPIALAVGGAVVLCTLFYMYNQNKSLRKELELLKKDFEEFKESVKQNMTYLYHRSNDGRSDGRSNGERERSEEVEKPPVRIRKKVRINENKEVINDVKEEVKKIEEDKKESEKKEERKEERRGDDRKRDERKDERREEPKKEVPPSTQILSKKEDEDFTTELGSEMEELDS